MLTIARSLSVSLFPSLLNRKYSGCMSVARESIFFSSCDFFYPLFRKVFPDKRITRMARFAKSLVRAKAKSDDLSLSPKATSNFFLFTFYTYKESLSLILTGILSHSSSFSLPNQRADVRIFRKFRFHATITFRIKLFEKLRSVYSCVIKDINDEMRIFILIHRRKVRRWR